MTRVNRTLRRKGVEGLFCTLAYALFDFPDRTLALANSGLPYPVHYRAGTGRAAPVPVSGLPLGTFDGVAYDEVTVPLEASDLVVFYTDGLVEARWGREEYGQDRLLRGIEAHASLGAAGVGERLVGEVEEFLAGESPADDVTLIVVKVL
jgi:sigma-B regulation protein RsbU (phosphoserine phosphatase)